MIQIAVVQSLQSYVTEHTPPEGLNAPCLHVCMVTLASLFMQLDMTAECGCLRTGRAWPP